MGLVRVEVSFELLRGDQDKLRRVRADKISYGGDKNWYQ